MAVFSCSNYPKGYFNAYAEAAKTADLDVALHLGDYIYEYGMFEADGVTPGYATENAANIGRVLPDDNDTELLELDDYRKRYALYHTDAGSIALHAAVPMIVVWDDHEVANDAYKTGAENHDDATEGSFEARKLAALQAYFEWLPIRPFTENDQETIYRSFDFGDLVSLHMLDTRLIGRDKQLSYADYFTTTGFDATSFQTDLTDSTRTMLGSEQFTWLQGKLSASSATWQVFGQQVLIGKMSLPSEIITLVGQLDSVSGDAKTALLTQLSTTITELATIKGRILQGDMTVTDTDKARVETVMPYNLDAWDGYYYEREALFTTVRSLDKNLVVLSGDTHNAWANDLKDMSDNQIGVEFAGTSVSSPGMEEYVGLADDTTAAQFAGALELLVDDLQYTNQNRRGFLEVTFTPTQTNAKWQFVSSIDSTTYTIDSALTKELKVLTGSGNRKVEAIS